MIQLLKFFIILIPATAGAADLTRGLRYCEELEESQIPASKAFQKNYIQSYLDMVRECTAGAVERASFHTRLLNQISLLENNDHFLELLETSIQLILENTKTPSAEEISSLTESIQLDSKTSAHSKGFFLRPAYYKHPIPMAGYPQVKQTSSTLLDHNFEVTSMTTVFYSPFFICVETPGYKNILQPLLHWMEHHLEEFQASMALYDSFFLMSLSTADFNEPQSLLNIFPYRNFSYNINASQIERYLQFYEEIKSEYSDEFNSSFAEDFLHPYLRRLKIKETVDKKILKLCQINKTKSNASFELKHTIYTLTSSDLSLEERNVMFEKLRQNFLKKYTGKNIGAYSASIDPEAWYMHLNVLK